jgi:hypothetical protein
VNLDFSNSPGFSWYVVLLAFSGIVMAVLAVIKGNQSTGMRIFNGLVGLAFFGYAVYLAFIFQGGTYFILFKAFILPVLLVVNFFKSLGARRAAGTAAAQPAPYGAYPPAGQPGMPYPPAQAAPGMAYPPAGQPGMPYPPAPGTAYPQAAPVAPPVQAPPVQDAAAAQAVPVQQPPAAPVADAQG